MLGDAGHNRTWGPPRASGLTMSSLVSHLLLALVAVIVVGRLLGRLCRWFGQPPVIGEVVGGILLGPSLLGVVSPAAYRFLLPPDVVPVLGAVAELGVVLYMFLVGLEFDVEALRGRFKATVVIAQASFLAPFSLGLALAAYLYPTVSAPTVPFRDFALFIGVALSVTAFPVLARILGDLGLSRTDLGVRALASAAMQDVTALCALALVVGMVQASPERAILGVVLTAAFVIVMLLVGRPAMARLVRRTEELGPTQGALALTLVMLLGSAWTAHAIGMHVIIGAFLVGAILPHDSRLARAFTQGFEHLVVILLLPAFFAFSGMKTQIGLVDGVAGWVMSGLIILAATVGKAGGTFLAARATGLPPRQASALGVLMNTRGLMELIVLNIGLDLGVISPTLFTMMVVMALMTTVATTPVLRWIIRPGSGTR